MLRTAVAELGQRLEDVTFAVDPTVGPYDKRGQLGLRQIVPPRWWMGSRRFRYGLTAQRIFGPLLKRYPFEKLLDIYGGVSLNEIDALVDISGFAFTDQWGTAPIRDFARLAKAYKKKGKPVVMLPQGFGPFEEPGSQKAMADLMRSVDLAYARDDISLRHLRSVTSNFQSIEKAPDITLFYPEKLEGIRAAEDASHSCIIPNVRMLDQGEDEWGGRYEKFLTSLGNTLVNSGERVCFLIHDTTGKDVVIAKRVRNAMASTPDVIQESDPVKLKEFISKSRLIITSRYHGAVAAFSKAVPSLCLGWAHKYQMLYSDFGCPKHIIEYTDEIERTKKKMKKLLSNKENDKIRKKIYSNFKRMHRKSISMWKKSSKVCKGKI